MLLRFEMDASSLTVLAPESLHAGSLVSAEKRLHGLYTRQLEDPKYREGSFLDRRHQPKDSQLSVDSFLLFCKVLVHLMFRALCGFASVLEVPCSRVVRQYLR